MLYHISTDISLQEKTFIPRVPPYRIANEDDTVKRVSASNSLENCIASFPYKNALVGWTKPVYLAVYPIDESQFAEGEIKSPEQIEHLVGDAMKRQEHWIMREFSLKPTLIRIRNLSFTRYCKYTGDASGDVRELQYDKDVEGHDRVEKITFYHKRYFKEFKKVCELIGVEIQEVHQAKEKMVYYGRWESTKVYTVTRVTYKIPSGISASPLWEVITKEFKKNRRRHICYNNTDFM